MALELSKELKNKASDNYKDVAGTIKADSEEGKMAKEFFDFYTSNNQISYLIDYADISIEKDAYRFQQKFAAENFPEMFGITKEEALHC